MKYVTVVLFWLLTASTVFGQFLVEQPADPKPANLGQAIGEGAVKSVSDLEARIAVLEQLTSEYLPSYTWPGSDGAKPFEALREHLSGDAIHPKRNVAKWTPAELAFVHDTEHIEDATNNGKALGVFKDQRLKDWYRKRYPSRSVPLPKVTARVIKKLVVHRWKSGKPCPWCDRAENETARDAQADGIEVSVVRDLPDNATAPQIEVCSENNCKRLIGFVPWSTIRAMTN